ncbi:hypothetical protein ACQJBY_060374 [Aegilops geniculata]
MEKAPTQSTEGMAKAHGAAAALSPDGGYTSDTHDEGRPQEEGDGGRFAATYPGPKSVGRRNSLSDRINEWVSRIDGESLCIAEDEDVAVNDQRKDLTDYLPAQAPSRPGRRQVIKAREYRKGRAAMSVMPRSERPCRRPGRPQVRHPG